MVIDVILKLSIVVVGVVDIAVVVIVIGIYLFIIIHFIHLMLCATQLFV